LAYIEHKEVIIIAVETAIAGNIKFEFDDNIGSALLIITDTDAEQSVVLNSERISKAPKLERITAEAFLKEFSRKIGHDWQK